MKTKTLRFDGGAKRRLIEAGQTITDGQTFEVSALRASQLLANPRVKVVEIKPKPEPKPARQSWPLKPEPKKEPASDGGENKKAGEVNGTV